ncbi:MAG: ATP-binding protein [Planctomycetota bacterium]
MHHDASDTARSEPAKPATSWRVWAVVLFSSGVVLESLDVSGGIAHLGLLLVAGGFLLAALRPERLSRSPHGGVEIAGPDARSAIREYVAPLAHELRSPLTSIHAACGLLGDPECDASTRDMASRAIATSADHLLRLVNEVLDEAAIASGKSVVHPEWSDPVAMVTETLPIALPKIHDKQLSIELVWKTDIPDRIMVDRLRMRQVLLNLISNAVKYTDVGGITVEVGMLHAPRRDPVFACAVRDSGDGMTPEQVSSLFMPFERADGFSDGVPRREGTGLGLSVSLELCKAMGGDIRVESTSGRGSVFTAIVHPGDLTDVAMRPVDELPRSIGAIDCDAALCVGGDASVDATPGGVTAAGAPSGRRDLEGDRVLLVEDGVENRKLLVHILASLGADVSVACDGVVAKGMLTGFGHDRYDVVLLDLGLPRMSGLEVAREVRRKGCHTPIVALTAGGQDTAASERAACLAAGMQDFRLKPIRKEELRDAVLGQLRRSRVSA